MIYSFDIIHMYNCMLFENRDELLHIVL